MKTLLKLISANNKGTNQRNSLMKISLFMLCLTIPLLIFAQKDNTEPDPRLYDVLTHVEVSKLLSNNPYMVEYYNYFLDHSYKILPTPKQKKLDLPTVIIKDLKNFNILSVQRKQHLKRGWKSPTYYQIENTNKILVLIPEKEFTHKLNVHLGRS